MREKGQDWRSSVECSTGDYDDDDHHYYNDYNDDLIMTMFHRLSQVCYPSLLVTPQHWSRVPHARFDYFLRCESARQIATNSVFKIESSNSIYLG